MPLTNPERDKLVVAIKNEAIKLKQFRHELHSDNILCQQSIDNDLAMIHEHLRSLNKWLYQREVTP
jgi:hypothetical protein